MPDKLRLVNVKELTRSAYCVRTYGCIIVADLHREYASAGETRDTRDALNVEVK